MINARQQTVNDELIERLTWAVSKLEELGKTNSYTLGMVRSLEDCRSAIARAKAQKGE